MKRKAAIPTNDDGGRTRARTPSPVFEVLFRGPGIYPEKIPFGLLARALSAVQQLATGGTFPDLAEEEDEEQESGPMRLLKVARGSAVFQCWTQSAETARQSLRETGQVIEHPRQLGSRDYMLRPLETLSAAARKLGCTIVIREPGTHSRFAEIEPQSYDHVSRAVFVSGDTSIMGKVQRAGGATESKCALRVPFQQRLLFCRVDATETARQLGSLLYKDVVVYGNAVFVRGTSRIFSFTIYRVHELQEQPLGEALQEIWDAGASDWENVQNPNAFLRELREAR
ncbi:MAG TPA: hypothetical protein PKC45_02580 [Gemmatales bacterium]|mgnify:CR=1 FL=1|nr:hypothetical protein [Gemmatales bacterium]